MPDVRDLDDLLRKLQERHPVFFAIAMILSALGASALLYLFGMVVSKLK